MDEVMFGSVCDICKTKLPAEVGVESHRVMSYGRIIEEACDKCDSHVTRNAIHSFNVSVCRACADKVLVFVNNLYYEVHPPEPFINERILEGWDEE